MTAHLICILSNLPSDASALQSSISALEREIAALDKSSLSPEFWLPFFTVLVAIGVAVEIFVVLRDHKEDMEEWELCKLIPDKPSSSKLWLEIASVVLVTVGILGELGIGLWISHVNGQLRSKNEELRSKSTQLLALVTQQAGEAKDNALIAEASAKEVGIEAGRALDTSNAANDAAGKAQRRADVVANKTDELDRQVLDAKTQLDATETKRKELEGAFINMAICNAPRVLPFWVIGGKSSFDSLIPLAPYKAVIEYVPNDAEARRAAFSIAGALQESRWTVSPLIPIDGLNDGVEIQPFNGPSDGSMWGAHLRSSENAGVIVDLLHSYNWQAKVGFPLDEHGAMIYDPKVIPPDGLRITVGLYPTVSFVVPPGAKDVEASVLQLRKKNEERVKQAQKEYFDEEEKYLKTLTPEAQTEFKASQMESDARMKAMTDRYSNPCHPVNPLDPSFH